MFLTRFVFVATVAACGLLVASPSPVAAADGKVTGRVVMRGKPVLSGRVIFHLDNGQFVGSNIKDGKYAVDRVPVGTRKVTIEGEFVPATYGAEDTSPLKVEVREGPCTFDFSMQR
jgi:hypothetical protein